MLDAKALGDPGVLGTAKVALAMLGLQANAGPRDVWLPLKVCDQPKALLGLYRYLAPS